MNNLGGVYTTGTLTIGADRVSVTGVGTMWGPIGEIGDWILVAGQVGLILTVTDDTHLTLQSPWQGTLPAAANYVLIKMSWLRYEPALTQAKLRELLAELEGAGNFIFTDVAPPDPAIGNDGDWALKTNEQPWQVWFKSGGVWIEQRPPGFVWQGPWSAATTYGINDVVQRFGSSYVAVAENLNKPPESSAEWNLMAASGAASIAPSSIDPAHLNADTPVEQIAFRDRLNFVTRDAAGDTMQGGLTARGSASTFGSGVGLNVLRIDGGTSIGPVQYFAALGSTKIAAGFKSAIAGSGYDETFALWMAGGGNALEVTQPGVVKVPLTIASSSSSTGALVVAGGVGVGGALNVGGFTQLNSSLRVQGAVAPTAGTGIGFEMYGTGSDAQIQSYNRTTAAFSPLQFVGSSYTFNSVGAVLINSAAASSSTTTGALVVAGGVGVQGALNVGESIRIVAAYAPLTLNANTGTDPGIDMLVAGVRKFLIQANALDSYLRIYDADLSHGVALAQNSAAWVATSDRRLIGKQNARAVSGLLDRLDKFQLVEFGEDHSELGVIAQDLHGFAPQLVIRGDDDERTIHKANERGIWMVKPSEAAFVGLQVSKEIWENVNARLTAIEQQRAT
jgi:hypothetical protein